MRWGSVRGKAGKVWASWTLAKEYGFDDSDGRRPDWGGYFSRTVAEIVERGPPVSASDRFLLEMRCYQLDLDPERGDESGRINRLLDASK